MGKEIGALPLKHAVYVFVVVDPGRGLEDPPTILGVYGSLLAAKTATGGIRRESIVHRRDPDRRTEIQNWLGSNLVELWEHDPKTDQWRSRRPVAKTRTPVRRAVVGQGWEGRP